MKISLNVDYLDGSGVTTSAVTPDFIEWEDNFGKSILALDDEPRITEVAYLAWAALRRQGKTAAEFKAWTQTVDSVSFGEPGGDPAPLGQAASTSD